MADALIVQLPSPPGKNVFREWSGGMGTSLPSARDTFGHDQKFYDIPFSAYLFIARDMERRGIAYRYFDFQGTERVTREEFAQVFAEHKPRVLVTQVNIPSMQDDLDLVRLARQSVPGLKVILVGATAKWFRERVLREGYADAVMERDEELLVAGNAQAYLSGREDLLQGCSVMSGGVVSGLPSARPMNDLDFVDFPAYEILDFEHYQSDYYFGKKQRYMSVFTSKGCPYRCGYCPYPYGFGRKLLYRSPAKVGADIERLKREFGVEQILFRDQVFTIDPRHARAVCEELIRRDLGIHWICETRYDLVDDAMLDLMHRAGCREIHYGLESADPEMFAATAKPDGPKSLDLFETVIGKTRARGIRVHVHLIVGMPDESERSVRNTIRWLRRAKPDSVQTAFFVPYPGTPLYDELMQSREFGDVSKVDWEGMGAFTTAVLPTRHLTREQVVAARDRIAVQWQFSLAERAVNKVRRLAGLGVA